MRKLIYTLLGAVAGRAFGDPAYPLRVLLKHFILQKIFRINGHVPWPVHPTSTVTGVKHIQRGTRCPGLSPGCYIQGQNGIIIGRNVWIGPGVGLISANHARDDLSRHLPAAPIRIGDNSWIGMHAVILPGVELGPNVTVGAGAVVARSFGGDCLIAGNPARVVKRQGPGPADAPAAR